MTATAEATSAAATAVATPMSASSRAATAQQQVFYYVYFCAPPFITSPSTIFESLLQVEKDQHQVHEAHGHKLEHCHQHHQHQHQNFVLGILVVVSSLKLTTIKKLDMSPIQ